MQGGNRALAPFVCAAMVAAMLVGAASPPAFAAPTATFDWRMPERFGLDQAGDRLVDYRQSADDLDFLFPEDWPVTLDGCDSSPDGAEIVSYTWEVQTDTGTETVGPVAECQAEFTFPAEGTYPVTLTIEDGDGTTATETRDVVVEDLLIVSVGDSIGSGEGNPDAIEPNFGLQPTSATWQNERCHRSGLAGSARAPRQLERRDPHTSVTFVHLACSGATIMEGLLGPYDGIDDEGDNDDPLDDDGKIAPQLEQVHDLLVTPSGVSSDRRRGVDAMLVSIGANDLEFSSIVKACLALATCYDGQVDPSTGARDGQAVFDDNIDTLNRDEVTYTDPIDGTERTVTDGNYGALAQTLANHFVGHDKAIPSPDRIFLTEYFDPTTNDSFDPASPGDGDHTTPDTGYCDVPEIGLLQDESEWAHHVVVGGLNQEVADGAAAHGWTFVDGIADDFLTHGYCARDRWTRTLEETFTFQGNPEGAFHPNSEGHATGLDDDGRVGIARRVEDALAASFGITAPPLPPESDLTAMDIAAGLGSATELLDQLDALQELSQAPGISDAADVTSQVLTATTEFLGEVQTTVTGTAHRSIRALESYLDDPDGDGDPDDDGTFQGMTIDSNATIVPDVLSATYQVQWRVTGQRPTSVPLSVDADPDGDGPSGPVTLDGADLDGDYAFEMNLGFLFDPAADEGERFALLTEYPDLTPGFEQPGGGPKIVTDDPEDPYEQPPVETVSSGLRFEGELDADLDGLELRLGVVSVDVSGEAEASLAAEVGFADPGTGDEDDGRITQAEWETTAPVTDLFVAECIPGQTPTGDEHPGSQMSLSATLDTTLPGGTPASGTITVADDDLCDVAAPTTNVDLGELANFGQLSPEDLVELVLNLAISLGGIENLADLELPFLEGRLTAPVTDPDTGEVVRPALVDLDGFLTDFLVHDFDADAGVEDRYATNPADPLGSLDRDKLETLTLDEFLADLQSYLGVDPGTFALDYDPDADHLSFHIDQTIDPGPAGANLAIGDILSSLDIDATGGVEAAIDPVVDFDVGVLFDVAFDPDDPQPDLRDRILLDLDGTELEVDAPVTANVDTSAQIGFLQVAVNDGTAPPEEHVDVLKSSGSGPMFAVDVTAASPISLADLAAVLSPETDGEDPPSDPPIDTTVDIAVPQTELAVSADLSGTPLGPCGVTLEWADVTTGTPQVTSDDNCFTDTFASFGFGDDPRALFGVIVSGLRDLLVQLDTLTSGDSPLRADLPLTGTSIAEVVDVIPDLLTEVEDLLTGDAAPHLQALESELETALAEALGLDPAEAGELLTFDFAAASGGTGGGTVILRMDLGACTSGAAGTAAPGVCDAVQATPEQPFTLDFDIPGGIAGLEGGGTLTIDYRAEVVVEVEIDLPNDPTAPGAAPDVFVDTDETALTLAVDTDVPASADTTFDANLGPAQVSLGNLADLDDDPDTDDRDPVVAHLAAEASLSNPSGRVAVGDLGTWSGGLLPDPASDPGALDGTTVDCNPDPAENDEFPACAHLPVYLTLPGSTPEHLGDIEFGAPDLLDPDNWQFDGAQDIMDRLASEEFVWAMLADGFRSLADVLADLLRASSYDLELPLVGDHLDGGAAIADQIEALADDIASLAEELGPVPPDELDDYLTAELTALIPADLLQEGDDGELISVEVQCASGATLEACDENHEHSDIADVEIRLRLGDGRDVSLGTDEFDLGLDGLRMQAGPDQSVAVRNDWSLDLGFGLSDTDGFFVTTEGDGTFHADDQELQVGTSVTLPDLQGEIAFVPFQFDAPGPDPDARVGLDVDLTGGGGRMSLATLEAGPDPQNSSQVTAALCGYVDLARELSMGGEAMGSAALPRILADVGLSWEFADCDASESVDPAGFTGDDFDVTFDNVRIDAGSLVDDFLEPLLGDVLKYVGPIRPIIDELYTPIPLVSDAMEVIGIPESEWPTWLSLLKSVGGNKLEMLDRIAEVSRFLDTLEGVAAGDPIPVGSFEVTGADATGPPVPQNAIDSLVGNPDEDTTGFANGVSAIDGLEQAMNEGGFSFPLLEEPGDIFGYVLGKDLTLVTWDAGELEAEYTLELPPIFIPFGPVVVKVSFGGFVGAGGHLEVSYDTYGIRQALQTDSFGRGFEELFGGIVLEDYRDGTEVPEIYLETGVFVSGSLDLLVAEGGARGKLRGELGFDLRDEDGKVRIDEIAEYFHRPICLFEVNGLIEVLLEVFAEIDVFLWSWSDAWEIISITLFEAKDLLGDACGGGDTTPDLATPVGDGVLRLNIGEDHAGDRGVATDTVDEAFTVRQIGDGRVEVSAFGVTEEETGVTKVVADAGAGDDSLEFASGVPPEEGPGETGEAAPEPVPFTIPVEVCLGPGSDRGIGGNADDEIHGDNGSITGLACNSPGDAGADVIDGGAGNDTLRGGGAGDQIQGGPGEDTIHGESGADQVFGGPDHDTIHGGADGDTLSGGPEPFDEGSAGSSCDDCPTAQDDPRLRDTINGDGGDDTIDGGFGYDTLDGGAAADNIIGGPGNDTVDGGSGADTIVADDGDDVVHGDADNDVIDGGPGDDEVFGDGGDDRIVGGPDNTGTPGDSDVGDLVDGGPGDDTLFGDDGDPAAACDAGVTSTFAGDDTVRGGGGVDRLCGQKGDDLLEGGADGDFLFGFDGDDIIRGGGGPDTIRGERGEDQIAGEAGSDTILGGEHADTITGGDGDDEIDGGPGADRIDGDADQDTIRGGPGPDHIEGDGNVDGAPDRLLGDAGDDLIIGGGSDDLAAPDARDEIEGGGGHDRIHGDNVEFGAGTRVASCLPLPDGSFGSDVVTGGLGNDVISGQAGNDELHGDAGNDLVFGELGNDTITGDADFDTLFGDCATATPTGDQTPAGAPIHDIALVQPDDGGSDVLSGGDDDDDLHGGAANDVLRGDRGDDRIAGNGGADRVAGGLGADDIIGGTPVEGREDAEDPTVAWAPQGDRLLGEDGADVVAGDNAMITRPLGDDGTWLIDPVRGVTQRSIQLLDVQLADGPDVPDTASGGDRIEGAVGPDLLFGQGGDDVIHGGTHQDLVEGNHGADQIFGGSGPDDLVGGGSANDGVIGDDSVGDGLLDGADQISGDGGIEGGPPSLSRDDVLAGDNARIVHPVVDLDGVPTAMRDPNRDAFVSIVRLFDVETVGSPAATGTSGAEDPIVGGPGRDRIYGQGGDDTVDAGPGDDMVEGNHGGDTVVGGPGADDVVGGGSSNTGHVDGLNRIGDGLLDGQDTLHGDGGASEEPATDGGDAVSGDNARIVRVTDDDGEWLPDRPRNAPLREIRLFDVQVADGDPVDPDTHDGEVTITGSAGNDLLFGQGGDDVVDAGSGDDYAEGNHGADDVTGGPGPDDLIGGGSSNTGVVGPDSDGDGLLDGSDTIRGDDVDEQASDGGDVIAGDNASIVRPTQLFVMWIPDVNRDGEATRDVRLFDVEALADDGSNDRHPGVAAGDEITGTGGADQLFGQGNLLDDDDDGDGRSDEDPVDGVDNDRDGREGADSTGFDCLDDRDNDGDGLADTDDPDCQDAIDEDPGGDVLRGGTHQDVAEGNHGSDLLDGGPGQDDLIGGSSTGDGVIGSMEPPIDLADGDDVIHGRGADDAALGDNGVIQRPVDGTGLWQTLGDLFPGAEKPDAAAPDYDLIVARQTAIPDSPQLDDAFGHDWMRADEGHDEFVGQQGDDYIEGNHGDDALIGDLGAVGTVLEDGSRAEHIETQAPFLQADLHDAWTLTREVTLFQYVDGDADDPNADASLTGAEGDDVLLGGDGTDAIHGGPGDDLINGDGDGTDGDPDPVASTDDADHLWGGDGHDAVWGGRGPDDVFGGYGDDHIDVFPRPGTDGTTADPPEWFTYASHDVFQGLDYVYGGWDQDAMQADLQETGPREADRLLDWVGAHNVYYVCDGAYGEGSITRSNSPQVRDFLETLSAGRGAVEAATGGTSGFRETAIVQSKENRFNQQPVHPDHPGHFTCNGLDVSGG